MSYSRTTPFAPDHPGRVPGDHLFNAWEQVRAARHLTYEASSPHRWQAAFAGHVRLALEAALLQARWVNEGAASSLRLDVAGGRFGAAPGRPPAHTALVERLQSLLNEVEREKDPDLRVMVELSERLIELEIDIARHHNILKSLLAKPLRRDCQQQSPARDAGNGRPPRWRD
jgi:hypothetical protein